MRRAAIERLLPEVYQRVVAASPLLAGYLDAMAALHTAAEAHLAELERCFDPRRAPDAFVPLLASWVVAAELPSTDLPHRRELTAIASLLARQRGTLAQLGRVLRLASGISGIRVLENQDAAGKPRPFHVLVRLPASAESLRAAIAQLVASEIPAHLTFQVTTDSEAVP